MSVVLRYDQSKHCMMYVVVYCGTEMARFSTYYEAFDYMSQNPR